MKMKLSPVGLVVFALLLLCTNFALGATDPQLEECNHQSRAQQKQNDQQKRSQLEAGGEETSDSEEQEEQNPYVFEDQDFTTTIQTQHGRVRILPRFTERSELLRGIINYRFAVLEAEPNTFIIPSHLDAEVVYFVASGKGAVSFVHEDSREDFNIRRGDIFRVRAGTTTHLINSDNNNRLVLAKLLQPVFTPGRFQPFFGAGGENPESFYRAFSSEILEAALNTRRDRIQRVFGQQKQGIIVKASEEQIRALSRHEETRIWPFRGESRATFNIFDKHPSHSNQFGQHYEVDYNEYGRLEGLDVAISLANISRGGMTAPLYNSRATKIAFVINGQGGFEMVCPHLSGDQGSHGNQQEHGSGSQHEIRGTPSYHRVSAPLKSGTAVIIPPGHPFVAVASRNQNLELVCFEINAFRNKKFPLAGRKNVYSQLEREAKELAFGVSAREVDEVFNKQQEEYFFRGPRQQQQDEGRAEA